MSTVTVDREKLREALDSGRVHLPVRWIDKCAWPGCQRNSWGGAANEDTIRAHSGDCPLAEPTNHNQETTE